MEDIMFFQNKYIREAMFTFEKNSFSLPERSLLNGESFKLPELRLLK